jgi:hypothetical protein
MTAGHVRVGTAVAAGEVSETRRLWLRATAGGALLMTVLDAYLLQRAKAFFTGGFLAPLHTSGPLEAAAFLGVSALADAALVGVMAWMVLLLVARRRMTVAARTLAVVLFSVSPLLLMDFVSYRLASYLGDAFDLGLMFELAGRRVDEIFAVASPQIVRATMLTTAASVGAIGFIWAVNRPRSRRRVLNGSLRRVGGWWRRCWRS